MAFASRERRSKPDKEQQDAERDRLEAALEAVLEGTFLSTFPASDAVGKPSPHQNATPAQTIEFQSFRFGSCGLVIVRLFDPAWPELQTSPDQELQVVRHRGQPHP